MKRTESHSVGAFEAKTHLSALLERVAGGEVIEITRRGRPVARLVPVPASNVKDREWAIAQLKKFAIGKRRGRLSVRKMIEEGRRY